MNAFSSSTHVHISSRCIMRNKISLLQYFCFLVERDPHKRRVKPVQKHLIQLNFGLEDSSDDSDFEVPKNGEWYAALN